MKIPDFEFNVRVPWWPKNRSKEIVIKNKRVVIDISGLIIILVAVCIYALVRGISGA